VPSPRIFPLLASFVALACAPAPADVRPLGLPSPHRVAGGEQVDIEDYPHQVSVQTEYGHRCGGSIVHRAWVLTAAHCVDDEPPDSSIVAGVTRLSASYGGDGERREVDRIELHPEYDAEAAPPAHDLALLHLSVPLDREPIPLVTPADADDGWTASGVVATVSGWGARASRGATSDALRAADLAIVANAKAAGVYGTWIHTDQMAAGPLVGGEQSACEGDSGGPLVVWSEDGEPRLAGVVSWGAKCGGAAVPGIYARVSAGYDWIRSTMDDDESEEWVCGKDELLCDESWCIPWDWVCDGAPDCDDETDELDC